MDGHGVGLHPRLRLVLQAFLLGPDLAGLRVDPVRAAVLDGDASGCEAVFGMLTEGLFEIRAPAETLELDRFCAQLDSFRTRGNAARMRGRNRPSAGPKAKR